MTKVSEEDFCRSCGIIKAHKWQYSCSKCRTHAENVDTEQYCRICNLPVGERDEVMAEFIMRVNSKRVRYGMPVFSNLHEYSDAISAHEAVKPIRYVASCTPWCASCGDVKHPNRVSCYACYLTASRNNMQFYTQTKDRNEQLTHIVDINRSRLEQIKKVCAGSSSLRPSRAELQAAIAAVNASLIARSKPLVDDTACDVMEPFKETARKLEKTIEQIKNTKNPCGEIALAEGPCTPPPAAQPEARKGRFDTEGRVWIPPHGTETLRSNTNRGGPLKPEATDFIHPRMAAYLRTKIVVLVDDQTEPP